MIECLRDPDISIRRRALDLSFFLINSSNIRILIRELVVYLEVCEEEIKSSVSARICEYAGRYRPNKRWEIDTVTRVLRIAGSLVDQDVINHFVKLVSTGDNSVHQYATRKLYEIVKSEGILAHAQEGLIQATFWCVGEYGDVLVKPKFADSGVLGFADETDGVQIGDESAPREAEVVDLIVSIMRGPYATNFVKEYGVTALAKLAGRFVEPSVVKYIC